MPTKILLPELSELFQRFLESRHADPLLAEHKTKIIHQVLINTGLNKKTHLSLSELALFKRELNNIVYLNSHLPNLIGDTESFEDSSKLSAEEKYACEARNVFRHLFRGTPFSAKDGDWYARSFLASETLLQTALSQRVPELYTAFRTEVQCMLDKAFAALLAGDWTSETERQYAIFQSTLLSSLPFMDPVVGESIYLPQKIDGKWRRISYQFVRLDVSPTNGLLAAVLEEEDHLYAYALESRNKQAKSHLLLMGTTHPTGQGSGLSSAYNFYPRHSVGEAHHMGEIDAWLAKQRPKNVIVTGQSKGGTMAMITAAKHPDKVTQAHCLNPSGLCKATLKRLSPSWHRLGKGVKPQINVYAQCGDPVFPIEQGFLEGTDIYRVISHTKKPAFNMAAPLPRIVRKAYEAHIHHFVGREAVLFLRVNQASETNTKKRDFLDDLKSLLNWFRFPLEIGRMFVGIIHRKFERFCRNHTKELTTILFIATLAACGILAFTGFLTPLVGLMASPLAALFGVSLSASAFYGLMIGLSIVSACLVTPLLRLSNALLTTFAKMGYSMISAAAHIAVLIIGTVWSGVKRAAKTWDPSAVIFANTTPSETAKNEDKLHLKTREDKSLSRQPSLTFFSPKKVVKDGGDHPCGLQRSLGSH
ncbi:MAG: alpha/beta hydrolase-fold protein [Legionellales bacterium]|nr:alpha/beta hydrolase-fold protein [Legionellales bacterium]